MFKPAIRLASIACSVLCAAVLGPAATRAGEPPPTAALAYLRLYAGPDGVSHFAVEHFDFVPIGVQGVEAMLAVHRLGDVPGAMLARLKAGATEDWHTAPRRQFMVCVQGLVEVTAGDGTVRRIHPGEMVLLEDLTGRGHRTHAVGSVDHVALALPQPAPTSQAP